jgi:hypothetical protein
VGTKSQSKKVKRSSGTRKADVAKAGTRSKRGKRRPQGSSVRHTANQEAFLARMGLTRKPGQAKRKYAGMQRRETSGGLVYYVRGGAPPTISSSDELTPPTQTEATRNRRLAERAQRAKLIDEARDEARTAWTQLHTKKGRKSTRTMGAQRRAATVARSEAVERGTQAAYDAWDAQYGGDSE